MTAITANGLLARATEILSRDTGANTFGWTKNTLARSKQRGWKGEVSVSDPKACRFCSIGAIDRAQYELGAPKAVRSAAMKKLENVMGYSIADSNDKRGTTFGQVLIAFDLAQLQPEA